MEFYEPLSILLVEDHEPTRRSLEDYLQDKNCLIQSVSSGLEALDLLNRDPKIRVVITDWMMPDLNGIALCRWARQLVRESYLYLLVLTVKEEEDDLRVALEAGADAFIPKNMGLTRLDTQLNVVRRGASLESQLQTQLAKLRQKEEELELRNAELSERNRQLVDARSRAESGSRAKTDFLANMSHEVRTPMNGILGLASLLLETTLTSEQREYAELVKLSAENLLSLISDILDLSKIEAGKIDIADERVNIHSFLFKTLAPLAPQAETRGINLTCQVDLEGDELLVLDSGKLRQVLVNLVGNALKFTSEGEVAVITCHDREGGTYSFSVRDTGRGIPSDRQTHIFEPFTQVEESLHRRYEGSGLGLTISRRLAQAMGGTLRLVKSDSGGSEFCLTVPARPAADATRALPVIPGQIAKLAVVWTGRNDAARIGILLDRWRIPWVHCQAVDDLPSGVDLLLLDREATEDEALRRWLSDPHPGLTVLTLSSAHRRPELPIPSFTVRRPVMAYSVWEALRNAQGDSTLKASTRPPAPSLNLLIAEDNPINLKVLITMLEKRGHRVRAAGSGREVLEIFADQSFDLILMDVQMPEGNGFTTTARIRELEALERRPRTPIIALTARAMEEDIHTSKEVGMDHYLTKPVQAHILLELLDQADAKRRQELHG